MKIRIGYDDADTLITYPRKGLDWAGTRALAVEMQPLLAAATAMERFPNNVACNSPEIASNIEFTSLELQRLWAVPFIRAAELHATFGENATVVPGARTS